MKLIDRAAYRLAGMLWTGLYAGLSRPSRTMRSADNLQREAAVVAHSGDAIAA